MLYRYTSSRQNLLNDCLFKLGEIFEDCVDHIILKTTLIVSE